MTPPDAASVLLAKSIDDAQFLRRRVDELLAANNITEEQRREAVRQRDVARDTVHVLQEALHTRNEMIAKLQAERVVARRTVQLFPQLSAVDRLAIAASCSDFLRRALERWQSDRYPPTDAGLVRALKDQIDAMVSDAAQGLKV